WVLTPGASPVKPGRRGLRRPLKQEESMIELVMFGVATAAVVLGHVKARQYVRSRLRFVDAVQSPVAPILAGLGGALLAAPVVWLLPFIGAPTAVIFGIGVGAGVHFGARDVRRLAG